MNSLIQDLQYLPITTVPGFQYGQREDQAAATGCTVVLCPDGTTGGVDQRGGAPGTRETDLLRPMHLVEQVHAVLLTGGSAYGLDAAAGVMKYLEQQKIGVNTGAALVPIVPAAVLYDLGIGDAHRRPDLDMGYQACLQASGDVFSSGNFGAGCGATVGKIFGMDSAMKAGIGQACLEISNGVFVGAIMAVNAFGDVFDMDTHQILAGARPTKKGPFQLGGTDRFVNTLKAFRSFSGQTIMKFASRQNTTIGAVITNAKLTKEEANKVAQMAQNGLALSISPPHTMLDGDSIFCLASGKKNLDVNIVGAYAPYVVAKAINDAVLAAAPLHGFPSHNSYSFIEHD